MRFARKDGDFVFSPATIDYWRPLETNPLKTTTRGPSRQGLLGFLLPKKLSNGGNFRGNDIACGESDREPIFILKMMDLISNPETKSSCPSQQRVARVADQSGLAVHQQKVTSEGTNERRRMVKSPMAQGDFHLPSLAQVSSTRDLVGFHFIHEGQFWTGAVLRFFSGLWRKGRFWGTEITPNSLQLMAGQLHFAFFPRDLVKIWFLNDLQVKTCSTCFLID